MTKVSFAISITADEETGNVMAVYFQVRKGKMHETREFEDGAAFADYNQNGELIGVEILSPCKVNIVDQLAANEPPEVRLRTKRFMKQCGPRQMIAA